MTTTSQERKRPKKSRAISIRLTPETFKLDARAASHIHGVAPAVARSRESLKNLIVGEPNIISEDGDKIA